MTHPIISRNPPPVASAPVQPPSPTVQADGRWAWPEVFHYAWSDGIQDHVSPLPPAAPGAGEIKALGESSLLSVVLSWSYRVIVAPGRQAEYDALARLGLLNDPRHTGRAAGAVIDSGELPL